MPPAPRTEAVAAPTHVADLTCVDESNPPLLISVAQPRARKTPQASQGPRSPRSRPRRRDRTVAGGIGHNWRVAVPDLPVIPRTAQMRVEQRALAATADAVQRRKSVGTSDGALIQWQEIAVENKLPGGRCGSLSPANIVYINQCVIELLAVACGFPGLFLILNCSQGILLRAAVPHVSVDLLVGARIR